MDPDELVGATLAGTPFRVNPQSVTWDWTVNTSATPTLGGKVIQVFGMKAGDLVVSGTFGVGGWEEQQAFLVRMKRLAEVMLSDRVRPFRFLWPGKGWDFGVYLRGFSSSNGPASVRLENSNVAPRWTLTLEIAEDNLNLRQVASDLYIARLSAGIGWKQSEFNGGLNLSDMQEAIGRAGFSTIPDYFAVAYGVSGGVPLGNIPAGTVSIPTDRAMTMVEVAQIALNAGFRGESLAIAVAIAMAESRLNPRAFRAEADNPLGGRDRGLWQINSKANPQYANDEEMFDPTKNAAAAWALSNGGTNWKPWYKAKTKLARIEKYLPEARAAAREVGGM